MAATAGKPRTGLLREFLRDGNVDLRASAVIGDRDTDLELARNIGTRGLRVRREGTRVGNLARHRA